MQWALPQKQRLLETIPRIAEARQAAGDDKLSLSTIVACKKNMGTMARFVFILLSPLANFLLLPSFFFSLGELGPKLGLSWAYWSPISRSIVPE